MHSDISDKNNVNQFFLETFLSLFLCFKNPYVLIFYVTHFKECFMIPWNILCSCVYKKFMLNGSYRNRRKHTEVYLCVKV